MLGLVIRIEMISIGGDGHIEKRSWIDVCKGYTQKDREGNQAPGNPPWSSARKCQKFQWYNKMRLKLSRKFAQRESIRERAIIGKAL